MGLAIYKMHLVPVGALNRALGILKIFHALQIHLFSLPPPFAPRTLIISNTSYILGGFEKTNLVNAKKIAL